MQYLSSTMPERSVKSLSLVVSQLIIVFQVYIYDPQYPAPPTDHGKSRLKDFRFIATAKHLIAALKERNHKVEQVVITGGDGTGTMLCEHYCCDFLRKDILSYLRMEQVDSSTESTHCKDYAWEKVYF